MLYRGDTPGFIAARGLRIYPALIIHVLFVMLIIGPLATSLPLKEFFAQPDWYLQPLMVLSFFETNMTMPGVFETNAEPYGSVPLWTLRFEVLAYIGTLIAFLLGLMRKKWMVLAQFILPAIAWIVGERYGLFENLPATVHNLARFGIAYGLGATLYAYRERLGFGAIGLVVMLGLTWITKSTPIIEVTMNLALAWFVMMFAYGRLPKFAWTQKLPDISYGIYIYHWAVMQMLFYWLPHLSVMELFALGFPITAGLAWLSWTYVEEPMLGRKSWLAKRLRMGVKSKPYDAGQMLLD